MVMDIIAQVYFDQDIISRHALYIIQISLNVTKTMAAVVKYVPTMKEALNVLVEMAMY